MTSRLFFRRPFSYQFKFYTLWLILINAGVFFLRIIMPDLYGLIYELGALNPRHIYYDKMYWQFLTYMFLHADFTHILFNMIGLLSFGIFLERAIGSKEFLLFYLICGILTGVLSYFLYYFTGRANVRLIGASGAIYAVLFGYAVCYPRSIIFIWGIIPVPAPLLVLIYVLIAIFSQMFGYDKNVAHYAHLFGILAAWLYFVIRMGMHPIKIWKNEYRR